MTALVEVRVDDLIGCALDWAIASYVLSLDCIPDGTGNFHVESEPQNGDWLQVGLEFCPSQDWAVGGPLIDKHAIGFVGHDADTWLAFASPADQAHQGFGPTHLIAACRMIVTAELGDTVTVPAELVQAVQP